MPDKPAVPSPTETTVAEGAEGADKAEKPTPEALLETANATIATLKTDGEKKDRDLSSLRGTVKTQANLRNEMNDKFDGITASFGAVAKAMEAGKSDGLSESLTTISAEQAARSQESRFTAQYNSLWDDLEEAVKGEDGQPMLDLKTAPELSGVRDLWNKGAEGEGLDILSRMGLFQQAIALTHSTARAKERSATKQAVKTAATVEHEEEVKDLHNDTGHVVAGAAESMESLMAQASNASDLRNMTPAAKQELLTKLSAKMSQELGVKMQVPQL